jgi:hypothetical protein
MANLPNADWSGVQPAPLREAERRRLANRMALAYLLDAITLLRGDRHLLDTLLAGVIVQANTARVRREADLQIAYARAEDSVPDEMRRPVSINAVAASLHLPFETVRRRVNGLIARGEVVVVDGGLVVPGALLRSPQYLAAAFAGYGRLQRFYRDLDAAGLIGDLPASSVELRAGVVPLRTAERLAADYLLRFIELLMNQVGEVQDTLLFVGVIHWNIVHLGAEMPTGPAGSTEHFVPDHLRRPINAAALARLVGLPAETVRRHLSALEGRGLCCSVGRAGVIVPAEIHASLGLLAVMEDNWRNLQRLFAALAQLGVLASWDPARAPAG